MNQSGFIPGKQVVRTLFATLLLLLICTSCGDVYRPVANPVIPPQPNPTFLHMVVVISGNGDNNPGASMTIDVSGDTAVSQSTVGLEPVHATFAQGSARVYVANGTNDSVSSFSPSSATPVSTTSLPTGAKPVFVGTTESANTYVANSGNNTVSVISNNTTFVTNTIPVGVAPVALAELPNTQKLYVANQGTGGGGGSVTSINALDDSVNSSAPLVGFGWVSPVWVVARSDSQRVYVLDAGSGLVSAIDTSADAVVNSVSVGVGANYMVYDPKLNRVYVVNPVAGTFTALAVSTDAMTPTTVPVANPISVAALPDGSRIYISSAAVSGANVTSSVTVLNTLNYSVKTRIPLTTTKLICTTGTWSELPVAAAADSTRLYVGNCDAEGTDIINTSNDTVVLQLPAPLSAQAPPPGGSPPPQNPVFVVAGP